LLGSSRSFYLFDHVGGVFFAKVRCEFELDNLPRDGVDEAGDQGDQDPDHECLAERDLAASNVFAVGTNAEKNTNREQRTITVCPTISAF
jgi:hypothetical protein